MMGVVWRRQKRRKSHIDVDKLLEICPRGNNKMVIIIFMSILNFYLESFGSEHSCHNKENYIEEYAK